MGPSPGYLFVFKPVLFTKGSNLPIELQKGGVALEVECARFQVRGQALGALGAVFSTYLSSVELSCFSVAKLSSGMLRPRVERSPAIPPHADTLATKNINRLISRKLGRRGCRRNIFVFAKHVALRTYVTQFLSISSPAHGALPSQLTQFIAENTDSPPCEVTISIRKPITFHVLYHSLCKSP